MIMLLKYWRVFALGSVLIGMVGFLGYIYHKGGSDRETKLVNNAIKERIEERDRLDKIRNSPLDVDDVISRLKDGTF